jgi:alpha-galactosidase
MHRNGSRKAVNRLRIAMIGAGSPGFSMAVAEELVRSKTLRASTFALMDIDSERLAASTRHIRELIRRADSPLRVETTTDRRQALEGAHYVVTCCEKNRAPYWIKDIEIPRRFGVVQTHGENGGPGGQIHAMRNITLFMEICRDMRAICPDAWLMNFTNPMSYLCTYFERGGGVKWLGFCHQAHGSFGVVAEMLGMEPGELEVITGGVNHFNWLMDIRRRGTSKSYLPEFLEQVRRNEYWRTNRANTPQQQFTRDVLEVFGAYPVGYDDHWSEYVSFFYPESEWEERGYEWHTDTLHKWMARQQCNGCYPTDTLTAVEAARAVAEETPPFPRDPYHPYYREQTCKAIEALETNTPTYFDAINIVNHGAISNLPEDAVVDIPGLAVGGQVRAVHVGKLPPACAELCRRQVALHEMVVEATMNGDRRLALQAMCLQPQIRSLSQARTVLDAFLQEYAEDLPQFQ